MPSKPVEASYVSRPAEVERALALAALAALAAGAGILEGLLTLPVPFLRLGLANVFVAVAVWRWGARGGLAVAAAKVLAPALFLGTLLSPVLPMNLGGTVLSWAVMAAVAAAARGRVGGVIPASAAGGALHGAWDGVYVGWLAGFGGPYLAPVLALWGLAAGVIVGIIAVRVLSLTGRGVYERAY